jgi:hypothetical protein
LPEGLEKLDFFDNIVYVWVFEIDDIAGGIEKLDLFDNSGFV